MKAVKAAPGYGITARDYLARANERLRENTLESLFYCAFELRSGIEARLQQYVEAQEEIANKKKRDWEIPKLAKRLEKVFAKGETIVYLGIHKSQDTQPIHAFYYTPVTSSLRKSAGKLGDYLHSQEHYRKVDDPWWESARAFLTSVAKELAVATTGTLLGAVD